MPKAICKAIIPVAGLGTRFLPATKAQPKEMLPLVDKPIIQYVVEEAASSGISNIIFITGRGKQAIENHFDHAYELEHVLTSKGRVEELSQIQHLNSLADFAYVRQGEPLGLGHAIQCAEHVAGSETVAVLLGDDVFQGRGPALASLIETHQRTGLSVVGVQEVPLEHTNRYGIVNSPRFTSGEWLIDKIVEKPPISEVPSRFAIVGRYILTPEVFDVLRTIQPGHGGEYQLTDALAVVASRGRLMASVIPQRRYDTGNKLDYLKASIDFALARSEFTIELSEYIQNKALELARHTPA